MTCLRGIRLGSAKALCLGAEGAMRAYLAFMGSRLAEMRRVLTQRWKHLFTL